MPSQFNPLNTVIPRSFRKSEYEPYEKYEFYPELQPVKIFGMDVSNPERYLKIDAAIDQRHEASMEITQHPVEIGADTTDFAIINPRVLELEGRISGIAPRKEGSEIDENDLLISWGDRVQAGWAILEYVMRNRILVTIETNLKVYENILIRSLSTAQDARTVRVLDFKAIVQEIIITQVRETELSKDQIAEGSKAQAEPEQNRGEVQGSEVSEGSEDAILSGVGK